MSELSELEGTELYLALIRRRIEQWEKAQRGTRAEHEAAEAFTRAFAELDLALRDGERLPLEWTQAGRGVPSGELRELTQRWISQARHPMRQNRPGERELIERHVEQLQQLLHEARNAGPKGSFLTERFGTDTVLLHHEPGEGSAT